jgi:hypothetical protein
MTIAFTGLPTAEVAAIRASGRDAYGNPSNTRSPTASACPAATACNRCRRGKAT